MNGTVDQEFKMAQWHEMINEYANLETLDSVTLNRLVRRIVVHETIDENHIRHQKIEIYFNFQAIPAMGDMKMDDQRPGRLVGDKRPVMNIDTGEVYDNISAASIRYHMTSSNCHIRDVCQGKRKTALGYHWKFVE